jgi:hypothetical protein
MVNVAVLITRIDGVALAGLTIGDHAMIITAAELDKALHAIAVVRSCWLDPAPQQLWAAVRRSLDAAS